MNEHELRLEVFKALIEKRPDLSVDEVLGVLDRVVAAIATRSDRR